ncbi:hypothetical protein C8Q80DRAFT_723901 [Daedaleopsis nitida]|nr:hypothetical protein C8Q80DRAFT_723901 [Daedaleopsis nitida]
MSPSSSTPQLHGVKRKKPPTFQHLPAQRAKKLKQSWVEVQKIKSKWKAQKRKEGLGPSRPQLERAVEEDNETHEQTEEHDMSDASGSGTSDGDGSGKESEEDSGDEASEDERSLRKSAASSKTEGQQRSKAKKQKQTEEQPSVRDLQRMAYSRSSLHTYKSNPLHRHKGVADANGRGSGGRGGRGSRGGHMGRGGRGGHQNRERGRGQPDMGLRMKAMLEKIKQDHT